MRRQVKVAIRRQEKKILIQTESESSISPLSSKVSIGFDLLKMDNFAECNPKSEMRMREEK
jgi:hypothetical protein